MIGELLDRLEEQVARRATLDPGWRPGTSAARIREAEAAIGLALPSDYRRFLERHDGQHEDFGVSLLSAGGRLAPLEEVVKRHAEMIPWQDDDEYLDVLDDRDRIRGVVFHRCRVEIGGSVYFDGDNTLLDYVPGPAGTPGQVLAGVSEGSYTVVGVSFADYLRRVVVGLERGLLTFTSVDGVVEMLDVAGKRRPWIRCEPTIRKLEPSLQ